MRIFILLICCMFSASVVDASCKIQIPPTAQEEQFQHGDEEKTITVNSLMWAKCIEGLDGDKCENGSPTLFTWQEAVERQRKVNKVGFADHTDWRLPTLVELLSLVERQCQDPAINPNHFPNTPSSAIWSQTPYVDAPESVWVVNFYYGLPFFDHSSSRLPVRWVRNVQ